LKNKRTIGSIISIENAGKFKVVKESFLRFVLSPNTANQEIIHVIPVK